MPLRRMSVCKSGETIKEGSVRVVFVSDCTARRIALLALSLTACSVALHGEERSANPPGQGSALPWLDLKSMSATRDRPLFVQDRRKLLPKAVAVPPPRAANAVLEQKKPQLTLIGIIQGPDGTLVLLKDETTSDFLTVRSGESIGSWRVIADTSYTAKLIGGKDEITLEMFATP
jgi:hypothetical protein